MKSAFESRLRQRIANPLSSLVRSVLRETDQTPRLLVSVRNAVEAEQALEGGADILDVKEPSRGSLGMATIADITAIANRPGVKSGATVLSVALGELVDWNESSTVPELPSGITFAKLGLSQSATDRDWKEQWRRIRDRFEEKTCSVLNWVAVAYADSTAAGSPPIEEVLASAIEQDCAGLLIDTWTKDGRTLLDEIDLVTIKSIATDCHASGRFLALAGSLQQAALARLATTTVDIVAVRSAACAGRNRTAKLDSQKVTEFQQAMRAAFRE